MDDVLYLVRCKLKKFSFRLLWNGAAMFAWRATGLERSAVASFDIEATSKMLWILANEAAAWCRTHGYEADNVPSEQELREYMSGSDIMPWELAEMLKALGVAMQCGDHQDYRPPEDGSVDVDTIELKKN